jgi:hypothetical protein
MKQREEYKGIWFSAETEQYIKDIIVQLYHSKKRVRFHWGDTKTGKDYGDVYDVSGTVGRSTGTQKIPLLIHNSRSLGGGAILDNCIVKITESSGTKKVLYQHLNYHI